MAIRIKEGEYQCLHCEKIYPTPARADACRESHDMVYFSVSRTDLSRLLQFIYTKNDELLTPTLMKTLRKHAQGVKKEDVVSGLFDGDKKLDE